MKIYLEPDDLEASSSSKTPPKGVTGGFAVVALSPVGVSRGRHHVRPAIKAKRCGARTAGYTLNWGMIGGLALCAGAWAGAGLLLAKGLHWA
jgi:hypothetical protein